MKHKKIVGLDLGDKFSYACLLDADTGEIIKENVSPHEQAVWKRFSQVSLPCLSP
jgi:hypothetical protein